MESMLDNLKLGYGVHLSDRVEELLREGTLEEILKLIEVDIDGEWKATPPDDTKTRELLYHEIHALNRIHIKLATIVDSIKMSKRGERNGY